MQFHGGVYRSDDAGESWSDIAPGLPSDFGFPLAIDPADADSAYVIPLTADIDRVTPEGRVRVYETRDAGATWTPRGDGLPAEHAYLTILREAFDWLGEGDALELYFGATSGAVFGSADAGVELVRRGDAPAARALGRRVRARASGISTVTLVPPPGGESTSNRPSSASTRSRSPSRPPPGDSSAPPDAVVADLHVEALVLDGDVHERLAGVGVLRDVGQRLGGDEVRGGLDRVAEVGHRPARDLHRHRSARGERLERRAQPAVAEQRRVDPARDLAQLLDGELGVLARLGDQERRARGIARQPRLGDAEREGHGDHPLLGAVMEVALDPPALGVGGVDDALPGAAQVVHAGAQRARSPLFG